MTRNENKPHPRSPLWKCIFSFFRRDKLCMSSAPPVLFLTTVLLFSRLSSATSHVDRRPNTHYITKVIDNHYDENNVIYQHHQPHNRGKYFSFFKKRFLNGNDYLFFNSTYFNFYFYVLYFF